MVIVPSLTTLTSRLIPNGTSRESPESTVRGVDGEQIVTVQVPPSLVHHVWLTVYPAACTAGTAARLAIIIEAKRNAATNDSNVRHCTLVHSLAEQ